MELSTLQIPEFLSLKSFIESHPRLCGYYLIDLVSIQNIRDLDISEDEKLDIIFEHFDDQEWPSPPVNTDHSWEDYSVSKKKARDHLVEALVGGKNIGHTNDTISPEASESIFNQFNSFFSGEKKYYIGMAFGDSKYVFSMGIAIIDKERAGTIFIVEND